MAKDLAKNALFYNGGCLMNYSTTATLLYNAGYRKQSEGDWIIDRGGYYQKLVCSACGKLSIATFDYCPNCGAKMKGGNNL